MVDLDFNKGIKKMTFQEIFDSISYFGGLLFGISFLLTFIFISFVLIFSKKFNKTKQKLQQFNDMEVYERQFDESD